MNIRKLDEGMRAVGIQPIYIGFGGDDKKALSDLGEWITQEHLRKIASENNGVIDRTQVGKLQRKLNTKGKHERNL
jgi:hypothetical protein